MSRRSEAVVDERLPTPLYHQIFLILHGQIVEGRLAAGAQVPGEEELARQFNVSRITARRALAELAVEGLVTRSRGRGTHVTARDHEPPPVHGGVEGLIENLMAMGLKTQVTLLDFGYEPAAPDVAAALQVAPGAEVQRAVRIRSLADGPWFAHTVTKTKLNQEWAMGIEEMIESEAQAQAICMATGDFRRAFEAFAAKQKPVFEGN